MHNQPSITLPLSARLEAVLFFRAEPMSVKELAKATDERPETVAEALDELKTTLSGRGVTLIHVGELYSLGTTSGAADLIEKLTKEELARDIGKAGLETLAIIMYKGSVTRREVDFIRGVNSTFIIRNLLIRGLIERVDDDKDKRQFRYRPTIDLLSHLGLSKVDDLPEFTLVKSELEKLNETKEEDGKEPATGEHNG